MKATLFIPGPPVAQPRPRLAKRGRFVSAYVPQSHPVHEYRRMIAEAAEETGLFFEGAVRVEFEFVFARPASHWNKSGLTKKAPAFPAKSDADNIMKACLDALNQHIYHDDSQVTEWSGTRGYSNEREGKGFTRLKVSNARQRSD